MLNTEKKYFECNHEIHKIKFKKQIGLKKGGKNNRLGIGSTSNPLIEF